NKDRGSRSKLSVGKNARECHRGLQETFSYKFVIVSGSEFSVGKDLTEDNPCTCHTSISNEEIELVSFRQTVDGLYDKGPGSWYQPSSKTTLVYENHIMMGSTSQRYENGSVIYDAQGVIVMLCPKEKLAIDAS
ncbi:hypothetical protein ANN_15364, partial [Periplaneta americana]